MGLIAVGAMAGLLTASSADVNAIDFSNNFFTSRIAQPAWSSDWAICHEEPRARSARAFRASPPVHRRRMSRSRCTPPPCSTATRIRRVRRSTSSPSFATLPLFATELALGSSLYNGSGSGGAKTAHAVVGAGMVGTLRLEHRDRRVESLRRGLAGTRRPNAAAGSRPDDDGC